MKTVKIVETQMLEMEVAAKTTTTTTKITVQMMVQTRTQIMKTIQQIQEITTAQMQILAAVKVQAQALQIK